MSDDPRNIVTAGFSVTVRLEIHDADAIARCFTDEWRHAMYDFPDRQAVIEHLAWHLGVREMQLSRLDGWADLPDDAVEVVEVDWEGGD